MMPDVFNAAVTGVMHGGVILAGTLYIINWRYKP